MINFARINVSGIEKVFFDTKRANPHNVLGILRKHNLKPLKSIDYGHKITWQAEKSLNGANSWTRDYTDMQRLREEICLSDK